MTGKGTYLAMICALMFVSMAFFTAVPGTSQGSEPPSRAGLYQHTESYNISFNKPSLYGTDDPYYSEDVEANTWDDVALVVFFQDKQTTQKTVGSYTLSVAEIYQTAFVPLDGTQVSTGTSKCVLLEDFTAAWCGPCTAVIGSMDRLNHDSSYFPDKYVGIEWHASSSNDVYYKAVSGTRMGFYSGPAYPTVIVGGDDPSVGAAGSGANSSTQDSNLKTRIDADAAKSASISILAEGGHDSSKAWVSFTLTVEDMNFDNKKTRANVVLIQDAHPRRHMANTAARLGWIANDHTSFDLFTTVQGTPPSITDVVPAADTVLSGDVEVSFGVTDADAPTRPITKKVEVKRTGSETWTNIPLTGGKFIWKTNQMNGANHVFPDGDYDFRITATDYWEETSTVTVPVKVLNLDAPVLILDDLLIQEGLDEGIAVSELTIYWSASDDEDGEDVLVDLHYTRPSSDWTPIALDLPNTGSYEWDLLDPRIPDGDRYRVRAVVTDSDGMGSEIATGFEFEINNPDPPEVRIISPSAEQELSGQPSIKWSAFDDEDEPTMLKADIYLSSDNGTNFKAIVIGAPNSGTYKFDSTKEIDGDTYKAKVVIRDTTGLSTEAVSPTFIIYNNDAPECAFTSPRENDVLTGSVELKWTAEDEEDETSELRYDLMYMFSTSTYWTELRMDEPNTGSIMLDTTELEEGDGIYTFRLVVKDKKNEMSAESRVIVRVYNPDAPVISERSISTPAEKKATITWGAYDDDPGETEGLKVWIGRSQRLETGSEEPAWTYVAEGITNSGRYVMDVSSLEDGSYKVMIEVYDCVEGYNLSAMEVLDLVVDNNDPPVLSFTQVPAIGSNNSGVISFTWSGTDPEGRSVTYSIYYRMVGSASWITLVESLSTSSFNWNTSALLTLESGDYQLRILGVDSSSAKLETEIVTDPFFIYVKPRDIDVGPTDDDDDDDDDGTDNMTTLIFLVLIITAVILVGLALVSIIIIRKRQEAAQLPPPGGMMMPPMAPPQTMLPGQTQAGPLPPQTTQPTLPPAPLVQPAAQPPAVAPQPPLNAPATSPIMPQPPVQTPPAPPQ